MQKNANQPCSAVMALTDESSRDDHLIMAALAMNMVATVTVFVCFNAYVHKHPDVLAQITDVFDHTRYGVY